MTYPSGEQAKVEFACDWRAHQPVQLDIGPVLHPDDAVANKVTVLFGRAAPRDYVDVHAALVSDRYTPDRLLVLAKEHDDGFDPEWFARALLGRGPVAGSRVRGLWPGPGPGGADEIRSSSMGSTHPGPMIHRDADHALSRATETITSRVTQFGGSPPSCMSSRSSGSHVSTS